MPNSTNIHERLSKENAIISVNNYDSEGFSTSKSFISTAQNALGKQHNICYVISKGQKFKSGTFKDHILYSVIKQVLHEHVDL